MSMVLIHGAPGSPAFQADALPSEPPGKPIHGARRPICTKFSKYLSEKEFCYVRFLFSLFF